MMLWEWRRRLQQHLQQLIVGKKRSYRQHIRREYIRDFIKFMVLWSALGYVIIRYTHSEKDADGNRVMVDRPSILSQAFNATNRPTIIQVFGGKQMTKAPIIDDDDRFD